MPTLFVVVPYFNEPETLGECIDRVIRATLPAGWVRSIVLVDDASGARGHAEAARVAVHHTSQVTLLRHGVNAGKGAALQTGFDWVLSRAEDADAVLVQDADLEYDPTDHAALIEALTGDPHIAVFGNRWHDGTRRPGSVAWAHRMGNRLLTALSNAASGTTVTDMECCYKLMHTSLLRLIRPRLTEQRFGIEPQLTAAIARVGGSIREVPVRYLARGFSDGKKIGPMDALRALWVIARERMR